MNKLYSPETIELISKGNAAFKQKLIETFVKSSDASIDTLNQGILNDNTVEIYNAAHKVKPSLQYIGANNLFELAKYVELNSKETNQLSTDLKIKAQELHNLLTELLGQVKSDYSF